MPVLSDATNRKEGINETATWNRGLDSWDDACDGVTSAAILAILTILAPAAVFHLDASGTTGEC